MSEEFKQRLFTPFEREDSSERQIGAGLGLSLTKHFVELMNGTIHVDSTQGIGTQITIHLVLPAANQLQLEEDRLIQRQNAKSSQYYDIKGAHLLLVEDHEMNRMVALRLLQKVGAVVDTAENGKIALEKFISSAPYSYDAILMDVRMPVMNGLTATQEIRALQRPDAKSVPIIAMTAEAFDQNRNETMAAGMNVHLSKPIQPSELYRTLAIEISARHN